MSTLHIRPVANPDHGTITAIYNHYIRATAITFEEQEISTTEMSRRIAEIANAGLSWLVAEQAGAVVGYAYAGRWKSRSAYRYSLESTIYLAAGCVGQGLGTQLYTQLLDSLRAADAHVVVGGIALPNAASVALHERLGFRKVAHFSEVGRKFARWIDVGYWQLSLPRPNETCAGHGA